MKTSEQAGRVIRWIVGDVDGGKGALLVGVGVFVYLAVMLHPWKPPVISYETLDGGYRAVLNEGVLQGLQFGPELVATTGPLGFLRNPAYYPGTNAWRGVWALTLAAALALSFGKLFVDASPRRLIFNFVVVTALLFFALHDGWRLLPLVGFLYLFAKVADRQARTAPWEVFLTAVLAVSSWILFTELLSGIIIVGGVGLIHFVRFKKISLAPLSFVAFLLFFWLRAVSPSPISPRTCEPPSRSREATPTSW